MNILTNIRQTLESIESCKQRKDETDVYSAIYEKYSDIPKEKLEQIIKDVTEVKSESFNKVDVKDASEVEPKDVEHTKANQYVNELDASENNEENDELVIEESNEDKVEDDIEVTEESDEDDVKDEIIVEDDSEDTVEDDIEVTEESDEDKVEDDVEVTEESDEDFDIYKDELDIVDGDVEKNEDADKIDLDIPVDDNGENAADSALKEPVNEDNNGAKAAIANNQNKGAFSADVDALTDYLNDY